LSEVGAVPSLALQNWVHRGISMFLNNNDSNIIVADNNVIMTGVAKNYFAPDENVNAMSG
jgi:hypothetical protein